MKRGQQARPALAQEADRRLDIADQIGDPLSPYLTTDEAARYLRFATAPLFYKWAIRHRVPVQRRGRTLLYDRRVLEAFLRQDSWTKRHVATVTPGAFRKEGDAWSR